MAKKLNLTKEETDTLEMVRALSHVPLSTIQVVLEALSAVTSLAYADALAKSDTDEDVALTFPYIGKLVLKNGELVVDWSKHSLVLKDIVDAKRAVLEDDRSLLETWRSRLNVDLQEALE